MPEINYSWTINKLECALSENGLTNIVKVVHWTYCAKCEDKYVKMSNKYPLLYTQSEEYINYSDLTPEIVIGWLESNLDVGFLRKYLEEKLNTLFNTSIVIIPLPWTKGEKVVSITEESIVDANLEEHITEESIVDANLEEPITEESIVDANLEENNENQQII